MVEFYICMQLFELINFEISGSGEQGIGGGSPPSTPTPQRPDPTL